MKTTFIFLLCLYCPIYCRPWGYYAHQQINQMAVYTLPAEMGRFFKNNIGYLREHSTDADKKRYADTAEAPRHYLDTELYEKHVDSIPRKWEKAMEKYGVQKLYKNGILPWQIQRSYYQLVNAFKERDSLRILKSSAYLGHYISDAHVPLHTTENHNGQLTNQLGIHSFWESRLPELFAVQYSFLVGRAMYVQDPLIEAWKMIQNTNSLVDQTLKLEAELQLQFPVQQVYSYSKRRGVLTKQYSFAYAKEYHYRLNGMVEKQMKASVSAIGSYWYTAWVDAGQPNLEHMPTLR